MATQLNFSGVERNVSNVSMENLLGHYGLLDGMRRVKETKNWRRWPSPGPSIDRYGSRRGDCQTEAQDP